MRFILVGDYPGISQLLSFMPKENIKAFLASSIRPQYLKEINELAQELRIPLLIQPKWESSAYADFVEELAALHPDILWVNSYSMIIRPDVLAIPTKGVLNIHAALLPMNRGSNPIQWAIINRQYQTGVTLHEVDSGLDSGPIIDQISVSIGIADAWIDIRNALVAATDTLIQNNLNKILQGNWTSTVQKETLATFGPRRKEEDGFFSWSEPVIDIYNKIRALLPPLPAAFYYDEQGVKQTIEEFQTMWQVTTAKYQRNCLAQLSLNECSYLRPVDSRMSLDLWLEQFDYISPKETGIIELKKSIFARDFVPFEIITNAIVDRTDIVFLNNLDLKSKTMQAHLVLHSSRMYAEEEVNYINQIVANLAKTEYGVELITSSFGGGEEEA